MSEEIDYYSDYLDSGSYEIMDFKSYMERRGSYPCQWCGRMIFAINVSEAIENNCSFVFVHDDEHHPCDAVFSILDN